MQNDTMKTSHEFARELLAGPDLPIVTPIVAEYDTDAEYMVDPVFTTELVHTKEVPFLPAEVIIISHKP